MPRQQAIEVDHHGRTIRGMTYLPAGDHRHPTVLLLHGFTGQRIEAGFMFVDLSRRLAQRGIAAVTFDFLGSGESDGSFDQMLPSGELADALHMSRWTAGQRFVDRSRMALLGFSLGGLVAACACGRLDQYKTLVLVAPTTPQNLCRHARDLGPADQPVFGAHQLNPRLFEDTMSLDPLADLAKRPRPTLIVQGTADTAVTPAVSGEYVDALRQAGIPPQVAMIDGAGHTFNHPDHRRQLYDTVASWLVDQLGV
jgi:dipeptidyl aminopeptidase/acylaminoacyl peptidase